MTDVARPLTKLPPPADLNAEAAVLGAMLYDQRHVENIPADLKPETFYSGAHRCIFEAIADVRDARSDVTFATVSARLRDKRRIEQLQGGAEYLHRLIDDTEVLTPNAFTTLVKVLLDKAAARAAILVCQQALARLHGEGDVRQMIGDVEREMQKLTISSQTGGLTQYGGSLRRVRHELNERRKGRGNPGLTTGFRALDRTLRYKRGTLQLVAARPGMGKTSFLIACARNAAEADEQVAIFSLEMIEDDLAARALCTEAGISIVATETRALSAEEFARIDMAVERLERLPIYIDDAASGRLSAAAIVSRIRRWASECARKGKKPRLVFVDYAGRVELDPSTSDERHDIRLGEVPKSLKSIAKELDITVVLLSQLNRGVESRSDKRPVASDLKDSGALEEEADAIVFLYRDEFYTRERSKDPGVCEIIIDKNRYGPTGTVKLAFDGPTTRFSDLSPDPERPRTDGLPFDQQSFRRPLDPEDD